MGPISPSPTRYPDPRLLTAGTTLGPYTIVDLLGVGGMGEVYRARDERLGREVAIKVLPEYLASDRVSLERFRREARAVAALSHPNIVAIFDVGSEGGIEYAVTELLEGETLRARIVRGPTPTREALQLLLEIADGVAAAHQRGIIHRDLKPENVFITSSGRVKVLDFGLARSVDLLSRAGGNVTATLPTEPGTVLGTVGYLSPEQVEGRTLTPAADVFALGCILYELITARQPFAGNSSAHSLVVLLHDDAPHVEDAEVDALLQRCLEKTPTYRIQTAGDLASEIRAVLGLYVTTLKRPVMRRPMVSRRALFILALVIVLTGAAWFVQSRRTRTIDHGYDLRTSDIRGSANTRRVLELALRADAAGDRMRAEELLEEAHRSSRITGFPAAFLSSFRDAAGDDAKARYWRAEALKRLDGAATYESLLVRYLAVPSADMPRELALANSALDVRPGAWRLRLASAHIHLNRRDREAALRELRKIDVKLPDDRRLTLVLADRASLGDIDGAERDLKTSGLESRPALLNYTRARIAWSRGDLPLAQRLYDQTAADAAAASLGGLEIEAMMLGGLARLRAGDAEGALRKLAAATLRSKQLRIPSRELEVSALAAYAAHHAGDPEQRDARLARSFSLVSEPEERPTLRLIAIRLGSPVWKSWPKLDMQHVTIPGVESLVAAREATDPATARRLLQRAQAEGIDRTNLREEAELLAAELGMPHELLPADPPYPMVLRFLAIFDLERRRGGLGSQP